MNMISQKQYNDRIPIILFIIITELILGGLGRIFYIPVRIGIFIVAFILSLAYAYKNKVRIPKYIILSISLLFLYCLSGVLIGIFRGNNIVTSLKDITNFLAILYIVIFICFINYNKNILYQIINLFRKYVCFISVVTTIIFLWSYIAKYIGINPVEILVQLQNRINYGLITGWLYDMNFARVYFANGIYMQIALSLVISDIFKYRSKKYYVEAIILIAGIFCSGTRGYWLGAILVIIMYLLINRNIDKIKIIKSIVSLALVIIPIFFMVPEKELVLDRVLSITDFKNDISNNIRSIQIECLNEEIYKRPVIGSGFGSRLLSYEQITGREGLNVEVYYLELIYKTGIIGILLIICLLFLVFANTYRLINYQILNEDDKRMLKSWTIATISVLIVGISNPYMKGSFGIFILDMLIVMNIVFEFNTKINSTKRKVEI